MQKVEFINLQTFFNRFEFKFKFYKNIHEQRRFHSEPKKKPCPTRTTRRYTFPT